MAEKSDFDTGLPRWKKEILTILEKEKAENKISKKAS